MPRLVWYSVHRWKKDARGQVEQLGAYAPITQFSQNIRAENEEPRETGSYDGPLCLSLDKNCDVLQCTVDMLHAIHLQ
jgi:hypothetical protein